MVPTVDSNVLIYAIDPRNPGKARVADVVVKAVRAHGGLIALQVINETYRVSTGKLGWPPVVAEQYLRAIPLGFPTFGPTTETVMRALNLASRGLFSIWDANLVAAAKLAGCTHVFSEDMAEGDSAAGLEIVKPFSGDGLSPRVRDLLQL